jgi:Cof subfamily protein (haloacid dehalogenase superfamily)
MGYKLICIDMDGTLLNSRKQISENNKTVLRKAREKGVRIAISTGRRYVDARYYADLIDFEIPIIAANGAYIQVGKQQKPIYQSCLGADLALRILNTCRQYRIAPIFHTPEREYCGSIYRVMILAGLACKNGFKRKARDARKWIWSYHRWKQVIVAEQEQIGKCVIISIKKGKLQKLREELIKTEALEVVSSWANNLELNCKGISKGKGVELLARYYNLKQEEIMAIGDSENDLSMLDYAGLGVAMGNAAENIKEKADCITDTNDNNGVAKAIEKYVLNPTIH